MPPLCLNIQAQGSTSFETLESFILGNINRQNSWQSTVDDAGIFPSTQTISNEVESVATYSLLL